MTASLLDAARELAEAGLCVLPAAEDGSKRPAVDWKRWQAERPDADDLAAWFALGERTGLGVVAGAVSGNLEMTELEGRAVEAGALRRLQEVAREAGELELWTRITGGFVCASPSGGIHFIYRVAGIEVPGNTKLAATAEHVTLAETRGEGGWFVTAPSFGHVHPTKRPWQVVGAGVTAMVTLTADERDRFHALIRTLDERPMPTPAVPVVFGTASRPGGTDGVSPGDDFTARTTWAGVLTDAGWTRAFQRGEITYWTRPGKTGGVSASTGYGEGDWLYVFTSSTTLEPERTYTRFGFHAAWHHHGDHEAAARDLQRLGYGKPATAVALPVPRVTAEDRTTEADTSSVPEDVQTFGLNDTGNAKLLVATHGKRLRFCPERGQWLLWTGSRWAWDEAGAHIELVKDVLETALAAAEDKAAVSHYQRSLSRRGVEAVAALARTDPAIAVSVERLDAIAHVLCTPGGVVDLRDGVLGGFGQPELHTRQTRVTPEHGPKPLWDQFLADTYGDDTELVAYMQRLLGYCITGEVSQHVLPFLYGQGRNGKSTVINVMVKLLGGYGTVAPGTFLTQGYQQHETEIARLHGARFCGCSETEPGAKFAEAKVKMLTGGDPITARFMRRDHFTYLPTCKLALMANDRPAVASGGDSFWRRVQLIHHRFQVPAERRIDGLDERMIAEEGPAILAWLIEGAKAFYATGLRPPASVRADTAEYARAEDDLGRFIEERLVIASAEARPHIQTLTSTVTAAYREWCIEEGIEPVSLKRFGMELRRRADVETYRSGGRRFYLGVSVADDAPHWSVIPDNPITNHN